MRKTFFYPLFILFSMNLGAQPLKKSALFLGNSYTAYNNLPQLVASCAASVGDTLVYDSNLPGGYTLEGHSTNSNSLTKIQQGNWDFVVLQEQSQRPSFPDGQVAVEVYPFAKTLDSLIRLSNPCGETMFYMTWGRKNGDQNNCPFFTPLCTYEGMDSLLRLRYMTMAQTNEAEVSPVGVVWRYLRANSAIELYTADQSHPSYAGSYAAACCFYASMFRKDPTLISFDGSLDAGVADTIRQAVKTIVFDDMNQWYIGSYDVEADFNFVQQGGNYTVDFTNLSLNADSYAWNFGTGTDTSANPSFTFAVAGTYTVSLQAMDACDTIQVSKQVTLSPITNVEEVQKTASTFFYPNPTKGILQYSGSDPLNGRLRVYNLQGVLIKEQLLRSASSINLGGLPQGLYNVELETEGKRQQQRVLIQ